MKKESCISACLSSLYVNMYINKYIFIYVLAVLLFPVCHCVLKKANSMHEQEVWVEGIFNESSLCVRTCVCMCMYVWTAWHHAERSEVPSDMRSTSDSSVRQTSGVILLENIHSCWRGSLKTAMLELMASLLSCYCYAFLPKFISTSCSVHLVASTWSCMECGSWDVTSVPRATLHPFCCCIEFTLLWSSCITSVQKWR